jgi:hypothetical protein
VFSTPQNRAGLSRQTKAGRAMRLTTGVYAVDATLPPEKVVYHHRFEIIAHHWPDAVLCDRTAYRGGEPEDGWMFVCHPEPKRTNDLRLAGLTVTVRVGPGPLPGDMPWPSGLSLSGPARTLVENITAAGRPPRGRPARQAGTELVEDRIDEHARTGGPGRISSILAELDVISGRMSSYAVEVVRASLAAVLGTQMTRTPTSPRLAARLGGQPYDEHRLQMLLGLIELLHDTAPVPRPALGGEARWGWLAFFEAYFSNFIEGTEFGVEEARRIAIDDEPSQRPKDAHDISATFRIASDPELSSATAASGTDFLELLKEQHAILMAARPEKRPGQLKDRGNFAGGYTFVNPDMVDGTLLRGFDALAGLPDPFHRSVALMLLITEVHPFDDGNGRLARLVANATLSAAGQIRIVIPTVYRNNYLAGLNGVSNGAGHGETLLSVLDFAQKWTATVDWSSFDAANAELHVQSAYMDAGLAEHNGIRLRLPRRP